MNFEVIWLRGCGAKWIAAPSARLRTSNTSLSRSHMLGNFHKTGFRQEYLVVVKFAILSFYNSLVAICSTPLTRCAQLSTRCKEFGQWQQVTRLFTKLHFLCIFVLHV